MNVKDALTAVIAFFLVIGVVSGDKVSAATLYATPKSNLSCTFEGAPCTFLDYDRQTWRIVEASDREKISPLAPSHDHTFPSSKKGHYLVYTNNTHALKMNIQIPNVSLNGSWCLNFFYFVNGDRSTSLNVSLLAGYDPLKGIQEQWLPDLQFTRHNWGQGYIALPYGNFTIEFEAGIPNPAAFSIIGLDDIRLYNCRVTKPIPVDSQKCDFESSLCGLSNSAYAELQWTRIMAAEGGKGGIGRPDKDHTTGTGNGYYIYAEAKSNSSAGDQARLVFPATNIPDDGVARCGQFYFYAFKDAADVVVYNFTEDDEMRKISSSWQTTTRQTDVPMSWNWVIAPLPPGDARLVVGFTIDTDRAQAGVAVDDFSIIHCPMVFKRPRENPRYLNEMSCDFEDSSCELKNSPANKATWRRARADEVTKPVADIYGRKDGHFMYLMTMNRTLPSSLDFPTTHFFNGWCLDFYFYVFSNNGSGVKFNIYAQDHAGKNALLFRSTDNKDAWQHARVPLPANMTVTEMRVVVSNATLATNATVYAALDNVDICSCKRQIPLATTASPETTSVTAVTVANGTFVTTMATDRSVNTSPASNMTTPINVTTENSTSWSTPPTTTSGTTMGGETTPSSGVDTSKCRTYLLIVAVMVTFCIDQWSD